MSEAEVKSYSKPIQLKAVGDDGKFSGYALTYDLDLGGDIITKEAVLNWLNGGTADKTMAVLWQHEWEEPIGVTTLMVADDVGLYVEGELTLGVQRADEARLHFKKRSIKGMSIGYYVTDREYKDDGVRVIKGIEIGEYSMVTRPMNPKAKISSMKTGDQNLVETLLSCDSIRALERTLRDEVGASNSEAKRLISHVKSLCDVDRDEQKQLANIAAALKSILEGQK